MKSRVGADRLTSAGFGRVLPALLTVVACGSWTETHDRIVAEALDSLRQDYATAFESGSATAVSDLHTDSAIITTGYGSLQVGSRAIADSIGVEFAGDSVRTGLLLLEPLDHVLAEGWAAEHGVFARLIDGRTVEGSYMSLFQEAPEGDWRIEWLATTYDSIPSSIGPAPWTYERPQLDPLDSRVGDLVSSYTAAFRSNAGVEVEHLYAPDAVSMHGRTARLEGSASIAAAMTSGRGEVAYLSLTLIDEERLTDEDALARGTYDVEYRGTGGGVIESGRFMWLYHADQAEAPRIVWEIRDAAHLLEYSAFPLAPPADLNPEAIPLFSELLEFHDPAGLGRRYSTLVDDGVQAFSVVRSPSPPLELIEAERHLWLPLSGTTLVLVPKQSFSEMESLVWNVQDGNVRVGTAVFTEAGERVVGSIWLNDGSSYRLEPLTATTYAIVRSTDGGLGDELPPVRASDSAQSQRNAITQPTSTVQCGGPSTIDVGLFYTSLLRSHVDSVTPRLKNIIVMANAGLQMSEIQLEFRLVAAREMPWPEGRSLERQLDSLTALDIASDLRSELGADVISLIIDGGHLSREACGIGTLLAREKSAGFRPLSVVPFRCAQAKYSLLHEIGHNLGLEHDIANRTHRMVDGWAHGWQVPGRYRTVMAYACCRPGQACDVSNSCPRVAPILSNPDLFFDDAPAGDSATANAARTLSITRCMAAAWR